VSEHTLEGIDALRALGAPKKILDSVTALIEDGREVKAIISDGTKPHSVVLTVDGQPVAQFNQGIKIEVEPAPSPAVQAEPRLADAPITQETEEGLNILIGRKQLIQLLLARGFKIPETGYEILVGGEPFTDTIQVFVPNLIEQDEAQY